jgi:hypothetical protein
MKLEEYVLALFYSNLFTCSSLVIKNWAPYTDPLGRIRVKMLISSVQYQIITIWPQFGGRNMSSKIGRSALHRSGRGGEGERGGVLQREPSLPARLWWNESWWNESMRRVPVLSWQALESSTSHCPSFFISFFSLHQSTQQRQIMNGRQKATKYHPYCV